MTARRLAIVYLLASVFSGMGAWFLAVGITSAADLAGVFAPCRCYVVGRKHDRLAVGHSGRYSPSCRCLATRLAPRT